MDDVSNIVSVSWGDHLVFGEGDGKLDTPDVLRRQMEVWREELGAGKLHWRQNRTRNQGQAQAAPGYEPGERIENSLNVDWDDFQIVPELARDAGISPWLYVSMFDEGWPLPSEEERRVSFHNSGHGQEVSWQSDFTIAHPEFVTVDRSGERRQWGVLSMAYPAAREHLCNRFTDLLDGYGFDGLFVCLRSQSRPAEPADEYGFNDPVRDEYQERRGRDIRTEEFDVQVWRDLQGEYLTEFFAELRAATRESGHGLAIGCARGDVIGSPMGNATLQWREWIERGLVDDLVINQSSSQCPSLWIKLWPMHQGSGYVQDYRTGAGMPSIHKQLTEEYGPALAGSDVDLYVARQWSEPSPGEEAELLDNEAVTGLVYSSFRHDNGELIDGHRGDWTV
jgi:hypothetical protein